MSIGRLKIRALFVEMEATLSKFCEADSFCTIGLEKQLLYTLYNIDKKLLNVPILKVLKKCKQIQSHIIMNIIQYCHKNRLLEESTIDKADVYT